MADNSTDFTQKYIDLLSNDLMVTSIQVDRILEADDMTEEDVDAIQSVPTGENTNNAS